MVQAEDFDSGDFFDHHFQSWPSRLDQVEFELA